ncbi:MAG: hypothetical protein ACLRTA_05370 [Clostridia bacterium]
MELYRRSDHSGRQACRDGKKWSVFDTADDRHIPVSEQHIVSDALERLIKAHVIKKDCLNTNRFDRTNWYAFTEYGEYLMKGDDEKWTDTTAKHVAITTD